MLKKVVLGFAFALICVAGFSTQSEARVGASCGLVSTQTHRCLGYLSPAQISQCLQRMRSESCNADRSMTCQLERCEKSVCVVEGVDTSAACKSPETCGNGRIDSGETCDQSASPNGCLSGQFCFNCDQCNNPVQVLTTTVTGNPEVCGNNIREPSEQCDGDPSACPIAGSTCASCRCIPPAAIPAASLPRCGDGVISWGEECDNNPRVCPVAGSHCEGCRCIPPSTPVYPAPVCGNGVQEGAEQCDGTSGVCPKGSRCNSSTCQCIR